MNEHLQERFGRSKKAVRNENEQAIVWALPQKLNLKVREYFEESKKKVDGGPWLDRPEFPSAGELLDVEKEGSSSSDIIEIEANRPKGAWESKESYLRVQYELLREDALRPLREAVQRVKSTPLANEDAFKGLIGIYDKVHVCGVTCSTRGIAIKVTFSLIRTGKKILWEQSKRLITGGLVVLTPKSDMFKSKAIIATVAARPLAALELNPPEIDLFIVEASDQEIDPAEEFVMVEDRGSLYEADRHTLLALQRMMKEPFPLSEHLVDVTRIVSPPRYVADQPKVNMAPVLVNNKFDTYENVDIINGWPNQPASDLDASQLAALHRILAKRLAIVQGPPGTGKTFVSVQAIRIMLANRKDDDPPIIVACQTNHAVDQLLRHIAKFEPNFIRLGGRSKDKDVVRARTLYNVRQQTSQNQLNGSLAPHAKKKMREMMKEFGLLLLPLSPSKLPLDLRTLQNFGLLTQKQADSLENGASQWVQGNLSNPKEADSPFRIWLGKSLSTVPLKQLPEDFAFEYEEAELEVEQLKELEAENVVKDDDDYESLRGTSYPLADNFTCRKKAGITEVNPKDSLKKEDMWKIPEADRPAVYRYLHAETKKIILASFREKTKTFNDEANRARIGNWERDENILKEQKVIGMTTTGLSKYRGLLTALGSKVVLIEEAAETLEALVTVACLPALQHLILVGDHQQLRPHCHVKELEEKYYLNISLFERLVRNKVEFSILSKQRRMIPEIRRLISHIYRDKIEDHKSVLDPAKRPNVPGMGGVNSFFFTHQWGERRDEQMSCYNPDEADMIVRFAEYLFYNGVPAEKITVLTFYNGQRKRILKQLRERPTLSMERFTVVTVDSYQGEENQVVLLSLVRSNEKDSIGFLDIQNRVCVALSRAQCGFYIFGNGFLLYDHKTCKIWEKVINIFANEGPQKDRLKVQPHVRLGEALPVRCSNHNTKVDINDAEDFNKINGGCQEFCGGVLDCGHPCDLRCHPFAHDKVNCLKPCVRQLACGHQCSALCGEICTCTICMKEVALDETIVAETPVFDGKETLSKKPASTNPWKSFADAEPARYAAAAAASPLFSSRASPLKNENTALVELQAGEVTDTMQQLSFGLDGYNSQPQSTSPTLIEEKVVANGTRTRRKERFVTSEAHPSTEVKEDWSKEASLLD